MIVVIQLDITNDGEEADLELDALAEYMKTRIYAGVDPAHVIQAMIELTVAYVGDERAQTLH